MCREYGYEASLSRNEYINEINCVSVSGFQCLLVGLDLGIKGQDFLFLNRNTYIMLTPPLENYKIR